VPDGRSLIRLVVPIGSRGRLVQSQHALVPGDLRRSCSSSRWVAYGGALRSVPERHRAAVQRLKRPVGLPAGACGFHGVQLCQEHVELRGGHLDGVGEDVPYDVLRAGGGGERSHVVVKAPVSGEEAVESEQLAGPVGYPLLVRHDLGEAPSRREGRVERPLPDLYSEDGEVPELVGVDEVDLHGEEAPVECVLREGMHVELDQIPGAPADNHGVIDGGEVKHEGDPGVGDGEWRGAVVEHDGGVDAPHDI